MCQQLSPISKPTRPRSGKLASLLLNATLTLGIGRLLPAAVAAQTTSPGMAPQVGMGVTSPPASMAIRPAGIPLGSTEIATPGLAAAGPPQGRCAASGNAAPGALFDGGGLSGTSLSCADSRIPAFALPPPSSVGRVGIPLGATELVGAGVSPVAPMPGSPFSGSVGSASGSGHP
ncbi:hypothetical protein [Bradyrhizobium sp. STM 3557]|uniref:hypothetical protein n=1 Tax=Bradyrhizobium sp. STM 3557 TaxID=578920 RepID=UPI00388D098A